MSDHVAGDGTLPTPASAEGRPVQPFQAALRAAAPEHIVRALDYIDSLSKREIAAFKLLGHGLSNRDIAQRLNLSERTVKRHVSALLNKLNVESRLQAGLVAQLSRFLQIKTRSDPKVAFTHSGDTDDTVVKDSPPGS